MSLVPLNASDIEQSDAFRLFQTTKAGVRYYVQPLINHVADAIVIGSRDFHFLCGQAGNECLLVLIRDRQILRMEPKPHGDLENPDIIDVLSFLSQWETRDRPNATNEDETA